MGEPNAVWGYRATRPVTLAAPSVIARGMLTRSGGPGRGIQHIDLAVADVQRSLDFYRVLLEPLGLMEYDRTQTYRGTEEVVYLQSALRRRCVAAGGTIQSPPDEHYVDHENEDYHAFFAFDPDGIRVEVRV